MSHIPFTQESALLKIRNAENLWNGQNPAKIAQAYTPDSQWRNRSDFVSGRAEIETFLTQKWLRELEYRLIKELWSFGDNRIAVRFAYEWHNKGQNWFRSYGNENWEFDHSGLMKFRHVSINDLAINEADRKFRWPLGTRPEDHPELTEINL